MKIVMTAVVAIALMSGGHTRIGHGPAHYCAVQGEIVMRSQKMDRH